MAVMEDAPRAAPRILLALAAASFLLVAFPGALAEQEEACRRPAVQIAEGPESWEPGQRFVYLLMVVNHNEAPVERVTARVEVVASPGWSASVALTSFTMGPNNFTVDPLTVTAPQRGTGLAEGELVVAVHFTCHRPGSVDAKSQATVTVPVALAPARIPWLAIGAGLGVLVVVVTVVYAVRARLPRVSVKAAVTERSLTPGKGVQYPLVVGNRRREPDGVALHVEDVPAGWSAHLAVDELELEPREERALWLMVRAPPGTPAGEETTLTVRATSRKYPRESAFVEVRARIAGAESAG